MSRKSIFNIKLRAWLSLMMIFQVSFQVNSRKHDKIVGYKQTSGIVGVRRYFEIPLEF